MAAVPVALELVVTNFVSTTNSLLQILLLRFTTGRARRSLSARISLVVGPAAVVL